MVAIRINGEESGIQGDGLPRISDIVELIKSYIDPEHIITSILIDGRELSDSDWSANPSQFGTAIIEIQTGKPRQYVSDRIAGSPEVVKVCYLQFRDSRMSFQDGKMQDGNLKLKGAVNTLQAFLHWYATLLELVPIAERPPYSLEQFTIEITEICKRICQQQLYQSWWALGETLKNELEPKLAQLEEHCRTLGPLSDSH